MGKQATNLSALRYIENPTLENAERVLIDTKGLIIQCARKFYSTHHDVDDFIAVGKAALIETLDKFDPRKAPCFTTYVVHQMMGKMRNYLRNCPSHGVHVPTEHHDAISRYIKATHKLMATKNAKPTEYELAQYLNMTVEELKDIKEVHRNLPTFTPFITTDRKTGKELATLDSKLWANHSGRKWNNLSADVDPVELEEVLSILRTNPSVIELSIKLKCTKDKAKEIIECYEECLAAV